MRTKINPTPVKELATGLIYMVVAEGADQMLTLYDTAGTMHLMHRDLFEDHDLDRRARKLEMDYWFAAGRFE